LSKSDFIGTDLQVVSSGEFIGAGSFSDLARFRSRMHRTGAGDRAPGPALNLSPAEIAAFTALRGAPTDAWTRAPNGGKRSTAERRRGWREITRADRRSRAT